MKNPRPWRVRYDGGDAEVVDGAGCLVLWLSAPIGNEVKNLRALVRSHNRAAASVRAGAKRKK